MSVTVASDSTALAAVLEAVDQPLELRDLPLAAPDDREVLVRVEYGGICGTDLHIAKGHLDVPLPLVLGHEGIGVIEHAGWDAVLVDGSPATVGRRIMWASSISCGHCWQCRVAREPTLCERRRTYGVNRGVGEAASPGGSWSRAMLLVAGTALVPVPPELDRLAAMSLACAGPTMLHALGERRPVRRGETVVVQGAGPVGMAAAAYAQLSGAGYVVLVDRVPRRLHVAASLGIADAHVDVAGRDPAAIVENVLTCLGGGRGADLVIECTGAPEAIEQGMAMCRRGGSYLIVGQYTDAGPAAINPHAIVYRQLDVHGSWAFGGAHLEAYVASLPRLLARHELARLVTPFALTDVNAAMRAVAAGTVVKAVVAP
jgi:threonine dehydrogenase-like Zn-dependent dehydrogenase